MVGVASTQAVWEVAQRLAAKYGGPRGVEKAAKEDPSILDALALPGSLEFPDNYKVLQL
eukprot:SM006927S21022  [mRNA]  locus=s6927:155:734:+ [translate_table: standard]